MLKIKQIKNGIMRDKLKWIFPFASKRNAPKESGINNKKENFAAFSLSIPANRAAEIVVPLLETPGKSASI